MARTREILFKIFYSSSFTFVFLLLIAFCGVAPADKLYESYARRRIVDIIIIAAAWILTALIAAFMYCTRLYTTRSILRDIPKTFLPIEREDLPGRNVYRVVQEVYARTAVVAYQAKPRGRRIEVEVPGAGQRMLVVTGQIKVHHHAHTLTKEEEGLLKPKWGEVKHPGWQSPASESMAGLEYARVADELIDLIEAKAVSLAPGDPMRTPMEDEMLLPDEKVVDMLTRPEGCGMRSYLAQLAEVGVLPDDDLVEDFLVIYEHSRFSGKPMTDVDFQTMMRLFAEILRNMQAPEHDLLEFGSDYEDDDDREDTSSLRRRKGKGREVAPYTNGHILEQRPKSSSSSTLSYGSNNSVIHNSLHNTSSNLAPPRNNPPRTSNLSVTSTTSEPESKLQPHPSAAPPPPQTYIPIFTSTGAHQMTSSIPIQLPPPLPQPQPPNTQQPTSFPHHQQPQRPPPRPHPQNHSTATSNPSASFYSAVASLHSHSSSRQSLHSSRSGASGASQGSVIRLAREGAGNRDVGSGGGLPLPYEIDVRGFGGNEDGDGPGGGRR